MTARMISICGLVMALMMGKWSATIGFCGLGEGLPYSPGVLCNQIHFICLRGFSIPIYLLISMSAFGDCLCNWIAGNFKGITTFVLRRILAIPSWVRPPIIWTLLTSRALPSTQNYSYFLILQGRFCFAKKNRKPREPLSLAIQFERQAACKMTQLKVSQEPPSWHY